jgi:hypothetical protein
MSQFFWYGLTVAQTSRLDEIARQMGGGFRGERTRYDSPQVTLGLLVSLALVAACLLIAWISRWQQRRGAFCGPRTLFFRLCRAHGLRYADWWLLWRLARFQQLEDRARLFLEPERFEPANQGPLAQKSAQRLEGLRARLFAGIAADQ